MLVSLLCDIPVKTRTEKSALCSTDYFRAIRLACIYSSCAPPTGFNPRWDCTLSFQLQVPELALVRFMVEDHDHAAKNDFVGQFTVPFTSLRTGAHHRSIHHSPHCGLLHSDRYDPSLQGIDMFIC